MLKAFPFCLSKKPGWFGLVPVVLCSSIAQAQTPSTHAAQQAVNPAPAADPIGPALDALKQPVSLQCVDTPLSVVLADLQKQSGVTLKADPAWVGGMPITSFTSPMPLGTMLQRLAELYDLTWRRDFPQDKLDPKDNSSLPVDPVKTVFVLYESSANRSDIARLKRLSWEPLRQQVAHMRQYVGLPDAQLAQMAKEGDLDAQAMLAPETRAGAGLLADVSDDMLEALIDKEPQGLAFAQLSSRAQQGMRFLLQQHDDQRLQSWQLGKARGDAVSDTPPAAIAPEACAVRYVVQGEGISANLHYVLMQNQAMLQRNAVLGHSGGDHIVWWRNWYERGKQTVSPAARAEARKAPVTAVFDMLAWSDALRVVHDKWKVNVFSDAYPEVPTADNLDHPFPQTFQAHKPLTESLNVGTLWGRMWWQLGEPGTGILYLRRDWYNWRDDGSWYAVNERLKQMKQSKKPLTLEEWTRVAMLSTERLRAVAKQLPVAGMWATSNRPLLLFYAGMSQRDRPRLWNGGLAPSSLDLASRRRLLQAVQAVNARATEDWLRDAQLCLKTANGASEVYFKTDEAGHPLAACRWRLDGVPESLTASTEGIQQSGASIK